ncbi:MAG: cobyrinate a,c-diamide synthase [Candidatus Humimicrobiaceae bacterium]
MKKEIKTIIPALMVAGVSSGSGKTTVTSGLIGAFKEMGLKVQAYKAGPDYIDTAYLSDIGACPAYNLDFWLMGEEGIRETFNSHSKKCDISIIEGVMGLFDGGDSSCAELAKLLDIPVILCVNCEKTGESVSAEAEGFINFDSKIRIAGLVLTKLSGTGHLELVRTSIEKRPGAEILGFLIKDKKLAIKERYLGLTTVFEKKRKSIFFKNAVIQVEKNFRMKRLLEIASQKGTKEAEESVNIKKYHGISFRTAQGIKESIKIAYSCDEAFNFYYRENIEILQEAGAELYPFSPLNDAKIPEDTSLLIIWGGFPEIFAEKLSSNINLKENILMHYNAGLPVYAECGGFIYLSNCFINRTGKSFAMLGLIPTSIKLGTSLAGFGYKSAKTRFQTIIGDTNLNVRGHEFHHSFSIEEIPLESRPYEIRTKKHKNGDAAVLEGYASSSLFASYLHLHFAGNPAVALNLLGAARSYIIKK